MAEEITLKSEDATAKFSYKQGLNLTGFKKGGVEVIQKADNGFIGPHFGCRHKALLGKNEDPYPHGEARYLPWEVKESENKLHAQITGDEDNSEGQKYRIEVEAAVVDDMLKMHHAVVSSADSLAGSQIHFRLPEGDNILMVDSRSRYYADGELKEIPKKWQRTPDGFAAIPLDAPFEAGFRPFIHPLKGRIRLITNEFEVELEYFCISEESSWYIHYPENKDVLSIAAVSSQNPWKPNLTVSSIDILLRVC
jgi:hypothetical protein